MKKNKFNLIFIFLFITNIISAQVDVHYTIGGTRCSMIPPVGFLVAANFNGFEDSTGTSFIMVTEIPVAYDTLAKSFTKEALLTQNLILIDKINIEHSGSKAIWLTATQSVNEITYFKQILLFGNDSISVLVNGMSPTFENEKQPSIKSAILTTVYDPTQIDNAREVAKFSINVEGTGFKYALSLGGFLFWSKDERIPTKMLDKAYITAGNSYGYFEVENKKQFCIDRLRSFPTGEKTVIKTIDAVTINNLSGYEIVSEGVDRDGEEHLIYLVILFNDPEEYFIILGSSNENYDQNLPVFKTVANTFFLK